jgi:hypothetical protein
MVLVVKIKQVVVSYQKHTVSVIPQFDIRDASELLKTAPTP